MAIAKMRENWVGKKRTQNNVTIESCYSMYADMANANAAPYIRLNNFSLYASTKEPIAAMLPVTISIKIGSGSTYTFTSNSYASMSGNSPSSTWMAYYVSVSSSTQIPIPKNAATFTITVTVKPANGSAITFTEAACGPSSNTITSADSLLRTGKIHTFNCASNVPVGANFSNSITLYWDPLAYYNGNFIYSSSAIKINAYVDAYTTTAKASSAFKKFYFALHNLGDLPDDNQFRTDANITMIVRYKSADFPNGIMISYCTLTVPSQPRETIDDALRPEVDASKYKVSATPSNTIINGKYVYGKTSITLTSTGKFKYGDTLISGSNVHTFTASFSNPYRDSTPEFAVEYYGSVTGSKWGRSINTDAAFHYTSLNYRDPALTSHAMHRCKQIAKDDGSGKCYSYGGKVYKLDDEGGNCLIEYSVTFSPLDNTNSKRLVISYSSGNKSITPSAYTQSGYIVVPANTEQAMDVNFKLYDKYHTSGLDAGTYRLSTAGVIMDFLNGGRGVAIGKVAEEKNVLDISPNWSLLLYKATIGDYSSGNAKDLIAWMRDIDDKLDALENS